MSQDFFKIVINEYYGGYRLSEAAEQRLREAKCTGARDDLRLIDIVAEMGEYASHDETANLKIVEIPIALRPFYQIDEYDGLETISYRIPREWLLQQLDALHADNVDQWKLSIQQKMNSLENVVD